MAREKEVSPALPLMLMLLFVIFSIVLYSWPGSTSESSLVKGINDLQLKVDKYYDLGEIANNSTYSNLTQRIYLAEKAIYERNNDLIIGALNNLSVYIRENRNKTISKSAASDLLNRIEMMISTVAKHF